VFSPDGAWIAGGGILYDMAAKRTNAIAYPALPSAVSTFAPDGTIALGDGEGVVHLYCPK
jgi:hypothetical protein